MLESIVICETASPRLLRRFEILNLIDLVLLSNVCQGCGRRPSIIIKCDQILLTPQEEHGLILRLLLKAIALIELLRQLARCEPRSLIAMLA